MTVADIGATLTNASRLGSNAGILLQAVENRAALAVLELEEAGTHLQRTLLSGAIAIGALLLCGVTVSLFVAAAFWDTPHRLTAIAIVGVLQLATAAVAAWSCLAGWRRLRLFTDLREQLSKDCACLREVLKPDPS